MLLTFLAVYIEIPAYAGMTMRIYFGKKRRASIWVPTCMGMTFAAPLFLFKLKMSSFQRKLEFAKLS